MIPTSDFPLLKERLYAAVLSDALDQLGYRNQSPRVGFQPLTGVPRIMGRCKTTLWADMYHEELHPYELELQAVDSCEPGDIFICAAGGSSRSGIWGELLATAAMNRGCQGALVHGAVRDTLRMKELGFPVFATGKCVYDSLHRQRVINLDVPVSMGGVVLRPGDLVFADEDGVVVIPAAVEEEIIQRALSKVEAESVTRMEIKNGMKATDVYQKYGIFMKTKQTIQGNDVPETHLPFSPGIISGGFLFVSGQASVDMEGKIVTESFEKECRRSFSNLERICQRAGLGLEDVIQIRAYVGREEDLAAFNDIYREFFQAPFPARSTLIGCLGSVLKFEVDAIARCRESESL